jgi:uncharacterized protein YjiS (DUF1127 family)
MRGETMTHPVASIRRTWLEKIVSTSSRLPSRMALVVEAWRERWGLERELGRLDAQGELDRVLSDAGLSRSEMPQLMNAHPGAARQFAGMMEHVGVDKTGLPATVATSLALREMQRQCNSCETWQECREWLASHAADDGYRTFCPNAHTFEELRDRQTHPPAKEKRPGPAR